MLREVITVRSSGDRRIVVLACGHTSIAIHQPVTGTQHECIDCDHLRMPPEFVAYKETSLFTQDTVPAGLLRDHSTKRGVWGQIVVMHGCLQYRIDTMQKRWVLTPGDPGIIPPEVPHAVAPLGEVTFLVRFFRTSVPL